MIEPQVEHGGASSNMRGADTGAAVLDAGAASATVAALPLGSEETSDDSPNTPARACFSRERNFKASHRKM
jgi:hypothetical protein